MTRFARSQGSKASNEKLPEDATPWLVMKQQILGSQQTVSKDEGFKSSLDSPNETNRNLKWATFDTPEGIHKQKINRLTAVENEGKKDKKKKSKKIKDKYLDNCDVSLSKLNSNSFVSKTYGETDVPNGFMSPKKKKLRKQKLTKKCEHVEGENKTDVQNKNSEDYISEHGDKITADNGSSKNISETKRMKKLKKKQNMQLVKGSNENYENAKDNISVSKNAEKMSKRKFSDVAGVEIRAESELTTHNDNLSNKNKMKLKRMLDVTSNCDKNKNIKKKKKRKDNSSVSDLSNRSINSEGGVVGEESISILGKNMKGYIGNKCDEETVKNSKYKNTSETKRMKKLKKKKNKQLGNISNENLKNEADQICVSEDNEKMSKSKCNLDIVELRNENKIIKLNDSRSKKKLKRKHDAVSNCDESINTKKKKRKDNNSVNSIQSVTETKKEERTQVLNKAKEEVASKKIKKTFDDHSLREVQKEMIETLSGVKPHAKKNNRLLGEAREFIINGMKVEIVKYQGFEIELEEAERIENLRKQLLKEKKVSYEEVAKIIKLERRKAEKALSRKKKKVCLKCRGYGHLLSQCPELEEGYVSGQGTGICFKCGSTEHTHFNCRVIRGDQYRFASCFMCGEEGHIARQCSLNSNGIYPKGGSCRNCGDVNHLMRNCPQLDKQKESKTITVGTIKNSKLESLEEDMNKEEIPTQSHRKNSIIKF